MSIPELIAFALIVLPLAGGFIYCLYIETKSNCNFRKKLISHMDRLEQVLSIKNDQ